MTKQILLLLLCSLTLASCTDNGNSQKQDINNMSDSERKHLKDSIEKVLSDLAYSGNVNDETQYHKALYNLDSSNIQYLSNYADNLARSGNTGQSLILLHNALKWSVKKAKVYQYIGNIWQIDGALKGQKQLDMKPSMDSSVFYYEKACQTDPNDVDIFVTLNIVHTSLGQYKEGIKDIEHAIKLQPNNRTHYLFRGICKFNLGDYHGAYEDLTPITSVRRMEYSWYYYRGMAAAELEKFDEAVQDLDTCELLNYHSADLYYYRGKIKTNIKVRKREGYLEVKKAVEMGYPVPKEEQELVEKRLAESNI